MSRTEALAERRRALVSRSDAQRAAMAAIVQGVSREVAIADIVVGTVRRVHKHRILVGAAATGLLIAPLAARTWIRRVLWAAPLVLEGYRLTRALRGVRRDPA